MCDEFTFNAIVDHLQIDYTTVSHVLTRKAADVKMAAQI
jgi:hypothetical protein